MKHFSNRKWPTFWEMTIKQKIGEIIVGTLVIGSIVLLAIGWYYLGCIIIPK